MTFICRLFRRKKKKEFEFNPTSLFDIYDNEVYLIEQINEYREKNGLKRLRFDGNLQTLAISRTDFWDENGYDHEDNLHEFFPGHAEPYKKMFSAIEELANYGITADFESFKNSPKHNPHLLGDYKYIGVSMLDKYCCVILGK